MYRLIQRRCNHFYSMDRKIKNLFPIFIISFFIFLNYFVLIVDAKTVTFSHSDLGINIENICIQDQQCAIDLVITKCSELNYFDSTRGNCYADNLYKLGYKEEICNLMSHSLESLGAKNACYDYYAKIFSDSQICFNIKPKNKSDLSEWNCIIQSDTKFDLEHKLSYMDILDRLLEQGGDRIKLVDICKKFKTGQLRGECFLKIVDEFNDIELCNSLLNPECGPFEKSSDGYRKQRFDCRKINYFYGACFSHIAKNTNNVEICEQAKNFKEFCYQRVAGDQNDSIYFRSRVRILGIVLSTSIIIFFIFYLLFFYKSVRKTKIKTQGYIWATVLVALFYLGIIACNYLFADNVHKNMLVFPFWFSPFGVLDFYVLAGVSENINGLYITQGVIFLHVLIILGYGFALTKIHQRLSNKIKKVLLLLLAIILPVLITYLMFLYFGFLVSGMN